MAEVELKFAVDPASRARLARSAPLAGAKPSRSRISTTYFDTPKAELAAHGMALRLRRAGRRWIQSLKAGGEGPGGLHVREEWEHERRGPGIDLSAFAATPLAALHGAKRLHERLVPVFTVDVVRTTWVVEPAPGCRLEVALDVGEVRSGRRSQALSELEIECLEGDARCAFDLARRLLDELPMRPSAVTKAERGCRLHAGRAPAPVKARPVALERALPLVEAARALVRSGLAHLQANEEGVLATTDPEFVHQARVAMRRTRSALRIFRETVGEERSRAWRDELGESAGALGEARDWDVFALESLPPALQAYGDAALAKQVLARAARRRARGRAASRAALAAPRHARAVLDLARWLSRADPDPPVAAEEPLARFAARAIRKRHKRLVEDSRHLARLDAAARHRLRIDAKRLRYGVEGLASLFAPRAIGPYRDLLAGLQDALGEANDAATAGRLVGELGAPETFVAFARGWFAARERGDPARLEHLVRALRRRRPPGS
ncbi:MAG TPA: CHAD domain-containing protein [Usitatibacter sp.]|nr:CHAD domain-containing protein [Usitatibacter sp.]